MLTNSSDDGLNVTRTVMDFNLTDYINYTIPWSFGVGEETPRPSCKEYFWGGVISGAGCGLILVLYLLFAFTYVCTSDIVTARRTRNIQDELPPSYDQLARQERSTTSM
jgi:hypothetical protein